MVSTPIIPPTPSQETYAVDEDQGEVFPHSDPFALFADWLTLANAKEINDPNAMSLATIGADGGPDVRVVLLKDVSAGGLTFYSSKLSAKAAGLGQDDKVALCFHWKSIRRQVRFRGVVNEVAPAEADAYFARRARGAQIGARASRQSQSLESQAVLEQQVAALDQEYAADQAIPRPDYWTGWRLLPLAIEFWVNRPYRLHERLLFERGDPQATWSTRRLYP